MARKDVHRPSVINPTDYAFVAFEYHPDMRDIGGGHFAAAERKYIREHMTRTGGGYSTHEHGGNCAVCGSVNAIYTALFHHVPTNTYVRTGLDCTNKLDASVDGSEFRKRIRAALEREAGKGKARAVLEGAGLAQAWDVYAARMAEIASVTKRNADGEETADGYMLSVSTLPREESTVCDIVGKLVQYGSISEAQTRFVRSLCDRIDNRATIEAKRAEQHAAAKPLPVTVPARITVCGRIVSIKRATIGNNLFSDRMLIVHADGWKVLGTLPTALDQATVGAVVEFSATVKPSNKDDKFGYYSRPTKARVVAPAASV